MNLDLTERKQCQVCGSNVLIQDFVTAKDAKEGPIWSGCKDCFALALNLPARLPQLIADAVVDGLVKYQGPGGCPMSARGPIHDALERNLNAIRWRRS